MSTMGYVTTLTGAEDAANLSLDFEKQKYRIMEGGKLVDKKFSDLITFTRTSTGGRFNEKGLYEVVAANTPRFDYNPVTKTLKGLLLEEQRTNYATFSNNIDRWAKAQVTTQANAEIAPDGTLTATKVVSNTVAQWHIVYCSAVSVSGPGATYTASVFVKAGEWDRVRIGFNDNTVFFGNNVFDLTAGTRISGTTGTITPVGNGWFRITHVGTSLKAGFVAMAINPVNPGALEANTPGDGVSGIYLWGGQFENGYDTSYSATPINFTSRSSTATYVDRNGIIRVAGVNVPRSDAYNYFKGELKPMGLMLETAATNLVRYSGMQSVGWTKSNAILLDNSAIAPDGTLSASLFQNTLGKGSYISQSFSAVTTPHTISLYVKPSDNRPFSVGFEFSSADGGSVTFDAVNKTFSGNTRAVKSYEEVGNGWLRVKISLESNNRATTVVYCAGLLVSDVQHSGYIWGYQAEAGAAASSYIPTDPTFTSRASTATYMDSGAIIRTAAVNVARDDAYKYDSNGKVVGVGLILEAAATNVLLRSQVFSGTGVWSKSGTNPPVVVDNTTVAPDGTTTAATVTLVAEATQDSNISQQFTTVLGNNYASSIYLKANSEADVGKQIMIRQAGNSAYLTVTLTDKWQRAERVEAANGSIGVFTVTLRPSLSGSSGTVNVNIWGAQLEAGLNITSYIPTVATTVTRAADVSSSTAKTRGADLASSVAATRTIDVANVVSLSPWYNAVAGTLTSKVIPGPRLGGTRSVFVFDDGAQTNRIALYDTTSGGNATGRLTVNSVENSPSDIANSFVQGVSVKAAAAWSVAAGFTISAGGKNSTTSAVSAVPPVTTFRIGSAHVGGSFNGYIQSTNFYPVRLSNAQLQILTE